MTMLLRSLALLAGLLLCAAGLGEGDMLPTAGEKNGAVPTSPNKTTTIATTVTPTNDSQSAPTEAVSISEATVHSTQPSTATSALQSTDHEPTSTATTLHSTKEAASSAGAPSTAMTTNNGTLFTSHEPQTLTINASTVMSSSSSSPEPNSPTTNSTEAHIHSTTISTSSGTSSASLSPSATMATSPNGALSGSTHGATQTPITTATAHKTSEAPTESRDTSGRTGELPAATSPKEPSQTDRINTQTIIMKEAPTALSSGSIAAITVTVIIFVLLVFGGAAYLKIRHSSYGRLVDDQDYGSWGNYNNPLYDDS